LSEKLRQIAASTEKMNTGYRNTIFGYEMRKILSGVCSTIFSWGTTGEGPGVGWLAGWGASDMASPFSLRLY
jgi:hypothetical protein